MWLLIKIAAAIIVYGTAIEPRFVVTERELAPVPNLPAAWEGKRIAVFSDLQVGMWWSNTDAARRLVRKVVDAKPAAVLIAGDFVYNGARTVDDQLLVVAGILAPMLEAKIPTYAVLGNHDYKLMNEHSDQENAWAHRVQFVLDSIGVVMMDNRVVMLPDSLYLAGVGERWAKEDHAAETVAKVPAGAARVVFMHDPDSYARIPEGQAPLAVAAHTHGMQLGVPVLSAWLWRAYFSDERCGLSGWETHCGAAGNRMYITRGVGFSALPARINAFPELTLFTLTRDSLPSRSR